ncbi:MULTISPECIES: L-threonylcarbamoyladenylate synthase [Chromobacterium]|jgi:tRNA threonylcarbamoyl adenosine modification protein (Sua5/YciO/YrdC/YwlC family)|uniref:L-threonylcarbamoyladenylate synthase n=1 Tax=Chromobacterium amazonense TaxID=1382803 RepID=A0ABU8UWN9_9NEIS|nr:MULTISPECIES: L-threonylcarbamoyladenylate synthase [Chromobacterium]MDQ4542610.1 L-threonylcarbamoyladenylate synthase [Chromobacterium amazonense]
MAQFFVIHPDNPQARLIREAVKILREGGVIVYPTDSCYALGCMLGDKAALERILEIRGVDLKQRMMTLVCHDLSELANYAKVDNGQFRVLKSTTPGSYTFILQATREVPRRTLHPKRSTIGLRVPDHKVALALLEELGEPILSCTLLLPGDAEPLSDPYEIRERLEHAVDAVIDGGWCGTEPTTVIDMTDGMELVRQGKGPLAPFGL